MGLFSRSKKRDDESSVSSVGSQPKTKKKKKKDADDDDDAHSYRSHRSHRSHRSAKEKKHWWQIGRRKKKSKHSDDFSDHDSDFEEGTRESSRDKRKGTDERRPGREEVKGSKKKAKTADEKEKRESAKEKEKEEPKTPKTRSVPPLTTPRGSIAGPTLASKLLQGNRKSQSPTPRTPGGSVMLALQALEQDKSRRTPGAHSMPNTPRTPGGMSSSGHDVLQKVLSAPPTPTRTPASPGGRGKGVQLHKLQNTPPFRSNVLKTPLGSASLPGSGRGRGGIALAAGILGSSLADTVANTLLNSPGIPATPDPTVLTPGRHVFILPKTKDDKGARGTVAEPQGDNVTVRVDPPWDRTHPSGPYERQRIRPIPPLRSHVETRHSNPELHARSGIVIAYDSERPSGVRVQLAPGPEGGEPKTVIMNYSALRPLPGPPPTPLSRVPSAAGSDPLRRQYLAVSRGRGFVSAGEIAAHYAGLEGSGSNSERDLQTTFKVAPSHVAAHFAAMSPGQNVTEQDFGLSLKQIVKQPQQSRQPPLQPSISLSQDGDKLRQLQQQQAESEKRLKEEIRLKEETRLKDELKKKERMQREAEEKIKKKMRQMEEREQEERIDRVAFVEQTRREDLAERFSEGIEAVQKIMQQREEVAQTRTELLALNRQLEDLKVKQSAGKKGHDPTEKGVPGSSSSSAVSVVSSVSDVTQPGGTSKLSRVNGSSKKGPRSRVAASLPTSPGGPVSTELLWANFVAALTEHGAQTDDLRNIAEDKLIGLCVDTLGFSKLDALRISSLWVDKYPPRTPDFSPMEPLAATGSKKRLKEHSEPGDESLEENNIHPSNVASTPRLSAQARQKGRRKILDPGSQDYTMVSEVLRHTTTTGERSFQVNRIVQLTPGQQMLTRYDRAKSRLGGAVQQPKVLYYSGPTLPSITEVMQSGFEAELRRSRVLQFSTEANIETAARQGGETVMLLLCEILAGRVQRVPGGSTATLHRQVTKHCGPAHPPKDTIYPADSVGMDYTYIDITGESKSATKYALTDPDRVIPRYLIYLHVSPREVAGFAGRPSAVSPTGHAVALPSEAYNYQASPVLTPIQFPSFGNMGTSNTDKLTPSVVMCPLHPAEELQLYCIDEEELTCTTCASVGRHSGKKCQPLSELLQGMRSHLAVHEKQVASKLARMETGLNQLQKQADSVRDAELRARRQIRQRTNELIEEVSGRREILEQELTTRAVDAAAKVQGAIRQGLEHAVALRQAHDKIKSLVDSTYSSRTQGISAKASDIIALSKLLEKLRHDQLNLNFTSEFALGVNLAEEINAELNRLRLPPPSITPSYYSNSTPLHHIRSHSSTPTPAVASPR